MAEPDDFPDVTPKERSQPIKKIGSTLFPTLYWSSDYLPHLDEKQFTVRSVLSLFEVKTRYKALVFGACRQPKKTWGSGWHVLSGIGGLYESVIVAETARRSKDFEKNGPFLTSDNVSIQELPVGLTYSVDDLEKTFVHNQDYQDIVADIVKRRLTQLVGAFTMDEWSSPGKRRSMLYNILPNQEQYVALIKQQKDKGILHFNRKELNGIYSPRALRPYWEEFDRLGLKLEALVLKRHIIDEATQDALRQQAAAKAESEAIRMKAAAQADATEMQANADAEASVLLAKTETRRLEALADALKIYGGLDAEDGARLDKLLDWEQHQEQIRQMAQSPNAVLYNVGSGPGMSAGHKGVGNLIASVMAANKALKPQGTAPNATADPNKRYEGTSDEVGQGDASGKDDVPPGTH